MLERNHRCMQQMPCFMVRLVAVLAAQIEPRRPDLAERPVEFVPGDSQCVPQRSFEFVNGRTDPRRVLAVGRLVHGMKLGLVDAFWRDDG